MEETVRDILDEKGCAVHGIGPEATIAEAVEAMCAHHVGALVVCAEDRPIGIVSERDVMVRVVLRRRNPDEMRVKDAMTRDVVCVAPEAHVKEAMATMTERRCRHLPVIEDGRLVGIISIGDLVRSVSREQTFEIRVLTDYITGAYPG